MKLMNALEAYLEQPKGGICENGNLCPYMANQTLPNKVSQIHRVLVVCDMPLGFIQ